MIYLTCCLPIPTLNILYWILKFISFLFENYELSFLHKLLDEFISIYYTSIPVWVFIIVSIIVALFFAAYIYSRFVDKKRSQLHLNMLFHNKKPSSLYSFLRSIKGKNVDDDNEINPVNILFKDMDFDDNNGDTP